MLTIFILIWNIWFAKNAFHRQEICELTVLPFFMSMSIYNSYHLVGFDWLIFPNCWLFVYCNCPLNSNMIKFREMLFDRTIDDWIVLLFIVLYLSHGMRKKKKEKHKFLLNAKRVFSPGKTDALNLKFDVFESETFTIKSNVMLNDLHCMDRLWFHCICAEGTWHAVDTILIFFRIFFFSLLLNFPFEHFLLLKLSSHCLRWNKSDKPQSPNSQTESKKKITLNLIWAHLEKFTFIGLNEVKNQINAPHHYTKAIKFRPNCPINFRSTISNRSTKLNDYTIAKPNAKSITNHAHSTSQISQLKDILCKYLINISFNCS